MAKSDVQYWLGLNDRAMEGAYVWNDANVAVSMTSTVRKWQVANVL